MRAVGRVVPVLARNSAALTHGYLVGLLGVAVLTLIAPRVNDAFAYWSTGFPPTYQSPYGTFTFQYSPTAAAVAAPLGMLPWPVFAAGWTIALGLTLLVMAGPWSALVILLPFVAVEFATG